MARNVAKEIISDMIHFPQIGVGALRVWQRNFLYFRRYIVASIVWHFSEPILYILAFGYGLGFFVGKIEGVPYLLFFAPAVLASTALNGAAFESTYSSFTKMRVQKTYETIMLTPVSVEDVVFGEIIWGATKAFFSVVSVFVVFFFFGVLQTWMVFLCLPVLLIFSWCMSAVSMVMTSYARDYDSFSVFFSLFITPMSLLSGTFFPISQLPQWAQWLAWTLPLAHVVKVCRELFLARWDHFLWINIAVMVVTIVLATNWSVSRIKRKLIY